MHAPLSPSDDARFDRLIDGALSPAEYQALLDSLDDLGRKVPGLSGTMDASRIGVGGHSLGAYTAGLIGGATVNVPGEAKPRSSTLTTPFRSALHGGRRPRRLRSSVSA